MDPLTISAASGLRSRMESLDLLANNLANADTGGYKTDREFYSLYLAPEAETADGSDPMKLPVIERNWIDFSQGNLKTTANPLDVALDGKGFFAVDATSGVAFTRSGNFRLSPAGMLVTSDGYPVRSASGGRIQLTAGQPPEILSDGAIRQNGQTVGQLAVVDFDNPQGLAKQGSMYFTATSPAMTPRPAQAQVHQGRLETSNVGSAESTVRLINVMRHFEMLQRAVTLGAEMNKKAIEEVARVG